MGSHPSHCWVFSICSYCNNPNYFHTFPNGPRGATPSLDENHWSISWFWKLKLNINSTCNPLLPPSHPMYSAYSPWETLPLQDFDSHSCQQLAKLSNTDLPPSFKPNQPPPNPIKSIWFVVFIISHQPFFPGTPYLIKWSHSSSGFLCIAYVTSVGPFRFYCILYIPLL